MKKQPYYDTCSCLSYWTVCGSAVAYGSSDNGAGRVLAGGGLPGEHEDIRVLAMSPQEARAALKDGRIADAKTIIGLQWLFAAKNL
jgi:hypothetical protein